SHHGQPPACRRWVGTPATRRGQPGGSQHSRAPATEAPEAVPTLTGPPTAAVTAHRSRCGPRVSGPRLAGYRRGRAVSNRNGGVTVARAARRKDADHLGPRESGGESAVASGALRGGR